MDIIMPEKKEVKDTLLFDIGEGPLDRALAHIKEVTQDTKYILFELEYQNDRWEDYKVLSLIGIRLETDIEFQERLERDAYWAKKEEEDEKRKYAELKKRFGDL
jgi:hypothetical protein